MKLRLTKIIHVKIEPTENSSHKRNTNTFDKRFEHYCVGAENEQ